MVMKAFWTSSTQSGSSTESASMRPRTSPVAWSRPKLRVGISPCAWSGQQGDGAFRVFVLHHRTIRRVVGGLVVHHDDFVRRNGLVDGGDQALPDDAFLVVGRNDNRYSCGGHPGGFRASSGDLSGDIPIKLSIWPQSAGGADFRASPPASQRPGEVE